VAAIDAEIGIGGEDDGIGQGSLILTRQASARLIGTSAYFPVKLVAEVEGGDHGAAAKKRGEARSTASAEEVEGFREDRCARLPGWGQTRGLGRRPGGMAVAAIQARS
jgi:hypothetical protein